MFKKILKYIFVGVILAGIFFYLNAGPREKNIIYGVSFSQPYANSLGLDWKQVLLASFKELPFKNYRIAVYWNLIQPEQDKYDYKDMDFIVEQAEKNNIKLILTVGRRVPRWPECHEPEWVKKMPKNSQENALMSYVESVVRRYSKSPAVSMWQVENEPFLGSFGICPEPDAGLLDREIALVKKIDPVKPILISDSGELSLWFEAGSRGDVFGTTMYRYVFSDVFDRYWVNYIPYWFYRVKAGMLKLVNPGKKIMIAELQAEPWTTKGILNTSIDEQFKTMSMQKFEKLLSVAKATGFSPQYLWGVEWWYWMKENKHPEFWEKAQTLK